eukprot:1160304-Pelagomonas_calceolata.AAC.1
MNLVGGDGVAVQVAHALHLVCLAIQLNLVRLHHLRVDKCGRVDQKDKRCSNGPGTSYDSITCEWTNVGGWTKRIRGAAMDQAPHKTPSPASGQMWEDGPTG